MLMNNNGRLSLYVVLRLVKMRLKLLFEPLHINYDLHRKKQREKTAIFY